MDLNTVWFILVGILFAGYAVLDGFDLGVGGLHLLTDSDHERRISLNSIGPVWDGNEVWLVTGGGALFAAFPNVYATAFSGFYVPFMLLLSGLIFRAVAIEFRGKQTMAWWRSLWDGAFSVSSILIALLMGITLGNVIQGVPLKSMDQGAGLGPAIEFSGTVFDMLNPYAILVGVTTVALFLMHGCIYLVLKTEGEMLEKVKGRVNNTVIFFVVCYASTTMATLIFVPEMAKPFREHPWLFIVALVSMLAIANIPREISRGGYALAFLSSAMCMLTLFALTGIGLYPNMLPGNPGPSLTIYNGASSPKTLRIMLYMALVGMPFVLSYTIAVYWAFRGKVKLDKMSY